MATVISPNNVDSVWPAGRTNVHHRHMEFSTLELRKINTAQPMVLVAIPCYNEEIAIGSLLILASKYADRIVVIDDGSTDRTAEIARAAGVDVIVHNKNEGKGAGIRDAFSYAREINADILVLIDGDGQHNPGEIPALIEPILRGEADIVNGSRFLAKGKNKVPKYRRVGQEVLTLVTNAGGSCKVTDSQNGFRAFNKNTFGCFSFRQNGMAIESEMLMDAGKANLDLIEVPISVRYDVAGSTYNPVSHGFSVLGSIVKQLYENRPLLFFSLPGFVFLALGTLFFVILSYFYVQTNSVSIVDAAACVICVLAGASSLYTGLKIESDNKMKARSV